MPILSMQIKDITYELKEGVVLGDNFLNEDEFKKAFEDLLLNDSEKISLFR